MRYRLEPGRPVVVKVGSSSLVAEGGALDPEAIGRVVQQVAELWSAGYPTVLVSSGAVAAGLAVLETTPTDLAGFQVAAAVGQSRLMERYTTRFEESGLTAGQVLLTKDVLANRPQYLNARETLSRMLEVGVVPVVNENDSVGVEELRFGDNDRLAAVVSHLAGAGMLVVLTDTTGLFSGDPRFDDGARLITAVRHTDEALDEVIRGAPGPLGSGGVATKVAAARIAAWSGIPTVIADSREPSVGLQAVSGATVGTWIEPHDPGLPARKLWIAFGQPAEGTIEVDDGAVTALVAGGKSLLAVGIKSLAGEFSEGAAVEVKDERGSLIAKGLVRFSSERVAEVAGLHSSEVGGEVIHRDDLVILADSSGG